MNLVEHLLAKRSDRALDEKMGRAAYRQIDEGRMQNTASRFFELVFDSTKHRHDRGQDIGCYRDGVVRLPLRLGVNGTEKPTQLGEKALIGSELLY